MTYKDIFINAKKLISDRKNWCTGAYARSDCGSVVPANSDEACRFCLMGAINRVIYKEEDVLLHIDNNERFETSYYKLKFILDIQEAKGHSGVTCFNDTRTHEDVLKLLDKAIENEG